MSPENRLADLLAAFDRLPRSVRRVLTVALPVALFGALLASLLLVPRTGEHGAKTRVSERQVSPTPSPLAPALASTSKQASAAGGGVGSRPAFEAIDAARVFIQSYIAVAYGRARAIRAASPSFARRLARQRPRVSAALRSRRPRVEALRVSEFSPGVALATAVVADGPVRYPLTFFLDRRADRWLVTRMGD